MDTHRQTADGLPCLPWCNLAVNLGVVWMALDSNSGVSTPTFLGLCVWACVCSKNRNTYPGFWVSHKAWWSQPYPQACRCLVGFVVAFPFNPLILFAFSRGSENGRPRRATTSRVARPGPIACDHRPGQGCHRRGARLAAPSYGICLESQR